MLFEVPIYLAISRIVLIFYSFSHIAKKMGVPQSETGYELTHPKVEITKCLKRHINTISHRLPWHCSCFCQALCAHRILKRKKIEHTIYFGVRSTESDGFSAHAWLRAGKEVITGESELDQFVIINSFAHFEKTSHAS